MLNDADLRQLLIDEVLPLLWAGDEGDVGLYLPGMAIVLAEALGIPDVEPLSSEYLADLRAHIACIRDWQALTDEERRDRLNASMARR